ncbi:MAG: fasciclin domain-containing protein [Pseudomonadota bacterium]
MRLSHIASTTVLAAALFAAPAVAYDHADQADIVDTAIAADDFNTLVAAVQAADLVDALKSEGPFTVFAPTDAAFAALPDGTLDTLLQPENKGMLAGILTYHVVSGAVVAAETPAGEYALETLNGDTVDVVVDSHGAVTVDGANVITADIQTSNGVIHVIDAVITPGE